MGLWNTHATALLAVDAWKLAHAWGIDADACADSPHEDHRRWAGWARRYRKRCRERNWTDAHCIAAELIAMLRGGHAPGMPGKIVFAGFDRLQPQQQSVFDALHAAGVAVELGAGIEAGGAARPHIRVCENQASEWLQAAQWAHEKLTAAPQSRIAIVAPNLGRAARAIEYACKQILCPREMLAPGLRAARPYHIALGENLSEYPVASAALAALAPFAGAPLSGDAVSRLLRSPFLRGAHSEAAARGKQERRCRRRLPYQVGFARLLQELRPEGRRADQPHCPILFEALTAAAPLLEGIDAKKPAAHWARVFADWLKHLGWPGELALDSDEYQAAQAFRRELRNLALLELTAAPMHAADALAWLQLRLAEQPFQVEAHDAPVQVLDVREAAGQRFDALWFGGLVEEDWPPPQRPSPFIAARLQKNAGIPEASVEGGREHAALLQQRLLASAGEAVLSWPRMEEDIANEPSALLDELSDGAAARAAPRAEFATPANFLHARKPEWEIFTDARAPAFAPGTAGGVSVIENQAKCPFRAFAAQRLGARASEENEQGLAAGERGKFMHDALRFLWEAIETSEKLHAPADAGLREMIDEAVEHAGREYRFSSGCGARFLQTQAQWAGRTLFEWLQNEKRRAAHFRARHLEHAVELTLSGLSFKMKIDRIDQLEDGRLVLIDYKTGQPDGAGGWAGARPQSPQLPLYALTQDAPLAALAYGRVKHGDCAFHGVADDADFLQPGRHGKNQIPQFEKQRSLKKHFANWEEMRAHWHAALEKLAREFRDGDARVAPAPMACNHCDLHGLCRIDEREN